MTTARWSTSSKWLMELHSLRLTIDYVGMWNEKELGASLSRYVHRPTHTLGCQPLPLSL